MNEKNNYCLRGSKPVVSQPRKKPKTLKCCEALSS